MNFSHPIRWTSVTTSSILRRYTHDPDTIAMIMYRTKLVGIIMPVGLVPHDDHRSTITITELSLIEHVSKPMQLTRHREPIGVVVPVDMLTSVWIAPDVRPIHLPTAIFPMTKMVRGTAQLVDRVQQGPCLIVWHGMVVAVMLGYATDAQAESMRPYLQQCRFEHVMTISDVPITHQVMGDGKPRVVTRYGHPVAMLIPPPPTILVPVLS